MHKMSVSFFKARGVFGAPIYGLCVVNLDIIIRYFLIAVPLLKEIHHANLLSRRRDKFYDLGIVT